MANEISKRVAGKVLKSLNAGAVPRVGARFIAVGRNKEIELFTEDFEEIADGEGSFRVISANYGGGKSFLLSLMKGYALDKKFVVMDATLNLENLFYGNRENGLNLYSQLINNLSIDTRPEGGALESLLQKWIMKIKNEIAKIKGCGPEDVPFWAIENEIKGRLEELRTEPQSYEFMEMIYKYARAYNNKEDVEPILRWFKGEYKTKKEVEAELNTRSLLERGKWFLHLRIWSEFVVDIGYSGLIVTFDEAQTITKLNKKGREQNFEFFLNMFNSTVQDDYAHLGIYTCMIPDAVENTRTGLYSYNALKSRLEPSRFQAKGDLGSGCMVPLEPLTNEDLYVLLKKIREIHEVKNDYSSRITDYNIENFLAYMFSYLGADEFLTPRDVLKNFIAILDRLYKHEDETFESIMKEYGLEKENDPFDSIPDDLDLDL